MVATNAEKRVTLIPKFLTTYGKPKIPPDSTKYIEGPIPFLLSLHRSPLGVGGYKHDVIKAVLQIFA